MAHYHSVSQLCWTSLMTKKVQTNLRCISLQNILTFHSPLLQQGVKEFYHCCFQYCNPHIFPVGASEYSHCFVQQPCAMESFSDYLQTLSHTCCCSSILEQFWSKIKSVCWKHWNHVTIVNLLTPCFHLLKQGAEEFFPCDFCSYSQHPLSVEALLH